MDRHICTLEWLGYIEDDILLSYKGIIINHGKDPYQGKNKRLGGDGESPFGKIGFYLFQPSQSNLRMHYC